MIKFIFAENAQEIYHL